jgi:hypothetical protein
MHMIEKQESRSIRNEIREILLEFWDPIGIQDEPLARDEYEMHIGGTFGLLERNANDKDLSSHPSKIIEERVQVHPRNGAIDETVKALRKIGFT